MVYLARLNLFSFHFYQSYFCCFNNIFSYESCICLFVLLLSLPIIKILIASCLIQFAIQHIKVMLFSVLYQKLTVYKEHIFFLNFSLSETQLFLALCGWGVKFNNKLFLTRRYLLICHVCNQHYAARAKTVEFLRVFSHIGKYRNHQVYLFVVTNYLQMQCYFLKRHFYSFHNQVELRFVARAY